MNPTSLVPSTAFPSTVIPSNSPSLSTSTADIITTIAGCSVSCSYTDNGQATATTMSAPRGVAVDSSGMESIAPLSFLNFVTVIIDIFDIIILIIGNVYIADSYNNRIRKVTISTGIITLIAGTGTTGFSGDNGAATSALLNNPFAVALDAAGKIIITTID